MRPPLSAVLWLGCFLGGVAGCQSVPSPAADRAAIVGVLDAQAGAWNRGDLETFMQGYWNSPDLCFTSGGRVQRGWDATLERYRASYPDRAAMGALTFDQLDVQLMPPDAAWVIGRWQLAYPDAEGARPPTGGIFTLVFRRVGDHWRIVHDHTSVLEPTSDASDDE